MKTMRFCAGLLLAVFLAGCETTTETGDPPKPESGERWLCGDRFDYEWSYKRSRDPSVILTRETNELFGYGKVVVGGVTYDAFFSIASKGHRGHRHPDTVAYLEGLGEEGASVLRAHEGGYTRYWLENGLHYDFRFAGSDDIAKPRDFLKCFQG